MNPVVWLVSGTAEWVVAIREDRMLYQISRCAWLTLALYISLFIALVVLLCDGGM